MATKGRGALGAIAVCVLAWGAVGCKRPPPPPAEDVKAIAARLVEESEGRSNFEVLDVHVVEVGKCCQRISLAVPSGTRDAEVVEATVEMTARAKMGFEMLTILTVKEGMRARLFPDRAQAGKSYRARFKVFLEQQQGAWNQVFFHWVSDEQID